MDDKVLENVIGMLEYDPSSSKKKSHREFLFEQCKFKEILPMANEQVK